MYTDFSYIYNSVAFEQLVFTLLSRETAKNKKVLYTLDKGYYRRTSDVDMFGLRFDAFAPNGIYDNTPTYVEITSGNNPAKMFERIKTCKKAFNLWAERTNKGKFKVLFVCQCSFHEFEKLSAKERNKILKSNEIMNVQIWWLHDVRNLLVHYPVERIAFKYSKSPYEQISIFDDDNYQSKDAEISKRDFNENNNEVINELKTITSEKKISLVLGTGVSIDYNKLTWNKIVNKMYNKLPPTEKFDSKKLSSRKIGGNNLSISQYIKYKLDKLYAKALYSILYPRRMKYPAHRTSLDAVCSFIRKGKAKKVITYNYDNFLEKILITSVLPFEVLYTIDNYPEKGTPIYHVHGYFPSSSKKSEMDDYCKTIVLTEEEYFNCYSDGTNWQIAIQLETFKDDVCLFIGNSITDYNEKRLLNTTKQIFKHHYAIMLKDGLSVDDLIKIYSYYEYGMNVRIIWVDSANDIVKLIDSL